MNRTIIITILLANSLFISAQDIRTSRNTSYFTYIYKLTAQQADKIYKKGTDKIGEDCFSQLLDSFATDKRYKRRLMSGHYLYVKTINNRLDLEVISENNVEINILNNNRDLSIIVNDYRGNVITDASLKIGNRSIRFNPKTKTYFVGRTNLRGLLKVTHMGHTNYFNVTADQHYSKFKIAKNKVLYRTPVKYAAIPVKLVLNVPYDTYRSIWHGRTYGLYYYVKKPFADIVRSISYGQPEGFIEGICNIFGKNNRFKGYIVFNKPKYLPGDTVFFKATITDEKFRPVKDSLYVELFTDSPKKLGWIKPEKPGIFTYSFVASKSLGMKLDKYYNVSLKKEYRSYMTGSFKFEEYELKSTKYDFRADQSLYHFKDKVAFYCKGTDENELQLPDARIELILFRDAVKEYYNNRVFIPDTLWVHKQNLDALGETKIIVPDSIFPAASIKVRAEATFLNSNNERQVLTQIIEKDNVRNELTFNLRNDTLYVDLMLCGVPQEAMGTLSIPGFVDSKEISLPHREKINPFAYSYIVSTDSLSETFNPGEEESNVNCYSRRDKDSVWFSIDNPRNLPLTYTIFRKNRPIFRGTNLSPAFVCKSTTDQNYAASVQYIWGAETKTNEFNIPFYEKQLKVNVFEPSVVYPGQKVNINVSVTDAYGKPVAGADLTALSITKKFNTSHVPILQYNGKQYPNRELFNNFDTDDDFSQLESMQKLNWKKWNPLMSLDTIERYKFLYPKNGYYAFTFERTDSTFAEVSPFLVDSIGNLLPVNILYIDNNAVYLSITTNPKPYVFRVNDGYHSIIIRTRDKEITLHSIKLQRGTKTILSINPYVANSLYSVKNCTPWYTPYEQNLIRTSVFAIRNNFNNSLVTLNQGVNYEILKNNGNYYGSLIVGPYNQNYFGFQRFGSFTTNTNFEQSFEYEFLPNLVKMRSWGILYGKKPYVDNKIPSQAFNDSVYTFSDIQAIWQQTINTDQSVKPVYSNPYFTLPNKCRLTIDYHFDSKMSQHQPKNILVFSHSDPTFFRIYPGSEKTMHDLAPGFYRIETILFDNSYIVTDSVNVKSHGINYCRYTETNIKPSSAYTDSISSIIQKRLYGPVEVKYFENYREEQEKIRRLAAENRNITYSSGNKVEGIIISASDGERLPGVNIVIKGTNQGVCSDIDGAFSINVPSGEFTLLFSFVGYLTEEVTLKSGATINITLVEDVKKLDEVVVIGYGTMQKQSVTGSVVTVSSALQGTVAGVSITGDQNIRVRGYGSIDNANRALIVVDGIPQEANYNQLNPDDISTMEILKEASATAIYGARAANGVILITTKKKTGLSLMPNLLQNKAFMEGVSQSKSLRSRFSDYAFWKPTLTTNKQGIASFEVTFPDDVTSWKTYFLAMGNKGASGQTEGEIKSFKPVMANLALPRFLVAGDQSNFIGKALNYTQDSIQVISTFTVNDSVVLQKNGKIVASRIDTLTFSAELMDSVKVQYQITKTDGYSDGELRYMPVFPAGTLETKGSFHNLDSDTTIILSFDKSQGKVTLHAESDIINVMLEEMSLLRNYKHYCNEQLSSKLKSMLWERKIFRLMHKECKYDKDIHKIIKLLEERRNADSLWGWWQNGQTEWWITLHATEALQMAKKDSFAVTANLKTALPHLYKEYDKMFYRDQMRAVKLLKAIDTVPAYKQPIDSIKISKYDTTGRYELWELKQSCGLPYPMDSLKREQKTTQFGNYYWGSECYSLFDDAISSTLVAYRILRKENPANPILVKIRNYMLERRGSEHWQNTWESCCILETILPDLIKNNELNLKPTLHFAGGYMNKVTAFPFTQEIEPGEPIHITKKSEAPVYFTAYQKVFNPNPSSVSKDFIVTSSFANNDSILKAGTPIKLIVNVSVKKASEYVMIEIPIPAGCSYQDKANFVQGEDYREYFKEKVSIYCSRLAQKNYTFEVNLLPRYNGTYHLNSAKAELMYFPVFFGREKIKTIQIR